MHPLFNNVMDLKETDDHLNANTWWILYKLTRTAWMLNNTQLTSAQGIIAGLANHRPRRPNSSQVLTTKDCDCFTLLPVEGRNSPAEVINWNKNLQTVGPPWYMTGHTYMIRYWLLQKIKKCVLWIGTLEDPASGLWHINSVLLHDGRLGALRRFSWPTGPFCPKPVLNLIDPILQNKLDNVKNVERMG